MSPEAKEAQREKSKFAIQKRCELETKEQTALAKDKHREKQRLSKRRKKGRERLRRKQSWSRKIIDLQRRENRTQRLRRKQNHTGKIPDLR
jgi:hypothetical protein